MVVILCERWCQQISYQTDRTKFKEISYDIVAHLNIQTIHYFNRAFPASPLQLSTCQLATGLENKYFSLSLTVLIINLHNSYIFSPHKLSPHLSPGQLSLSTLSELRNHQPIRNRFRLNLNKSIHPPQLHWTFHNLFLHHNNLFWFFNHLLKQKVSPA